MQLGLVERVRRRLANPKVSRTRRESCGELPSSGAKLKRPTAFLVLDEDHRRTNSSRLCADRIDSLDDPVDIEGGFFARTQSVLDIDDEECSLHGV
jgi:hypothetical protein